MIKLKTLIHTFSSVGSPKGGAVGSMLDKLSAQRSAAGLPLYSYSHIFALERFLVQNKYKFNSCGQNQTVPELKGQFNQKSLTHRLLEWLGFADGSTFSQRKRFLLETAWNSRGLIVFSSHFMISGKCPVTHLLEQLVPVVLHLLLEAHPRLLLPLARLQLILDLNDLHLHHISLISSAYLWAIIWHTSKWLKILP